MKHKKSDKSVGFIQFNDRKSQVEQGFFDGRFRPKVMENKVRKSKLSPKHKQRIDRDVDSFFLCL